MKKNFKNLVFLFLMMITFSFVLTACGNKDKAKLPSSSYEKVQFAFNC